MVGTKPRSPLCHGFQRGSSKRLPNSQGPKRRYSFLIAVRFSGRWSNMMRSVRVKKQLWDIVSRVQGSRYGIRTLMSLIWFAHHTCFEANSRSRTYVGRWCLGPVCPHTRVAFACELLVDGRDVDLCVYGSGPPYRSDDGIASAEFL